MRLQIAKVLPVLALSFVMAEAGAVPVSYAAAATATPPSLSAANPATVRSPNTWPSLIAARQLEYGLPGAGVERSRRALAEIQAPPAGAAKTSALMLSSLGMLGVISLLRLGRTL